MNVHHTPAVELNAAFALVADFDKEIVRPGLDWLEGWASRFDELVDLLQYAHPRQASMLTEARASLTAEPVSDEADVRVRLEFLRWGLGITLRSIAKGRAA